MLTAAVLLWRPAFCLADDYDDRYFEGLRQRGLHTLAEGVLTRRLKELTLTERERMDIVMQLSMTYADHASTKIDNTDSLWQQAIGVIDRFLETTISEMIHSECQVQRGVVMTLRGVHHYRLAELLGGDPGQLKHAQSSLAEAIRTLKASQVSLNELLNRVRPTRLSTARIRGLQDQSALNLANAYLHQSLVQNSNIVERSNALLRAVELLTPLAKGSPDFSITRDSQLLLAKALRIKGEGRQLELMIEKLKQGEPVPSFFDRLEAERIRLLLDRGQPTKVASALLERRRQKTAMPDELAFLEIRTLLEMRRLALNRKDASLAKELFTQAEQRAKSLANQSSGYWPAMARLTVQREQTSIRLGPQLAARASAAKLAYQNNEIEKAADLYRQAFEQAVADQQQQAGYEFGMSAGELLIRNNKWPQALSVYQRIEASLNGATDGQNLANAARAHLMMCYVQRQIEATTSSAAEPKYSALLSEHLRKYPQQSTVGDVRLMQGQMFQLAGQFSKAIGSYLNVPVEHHSAPTAIREAAVCCLNLSRTDGASPNDLQNLDGAISTVESRLMQLNREFAKTNPETPQADLLMAELALINLRLASDSTVRSTVDNRLEKVAVEATSVLQRGGFDRGNIGGGNAAAWKTIVGSAEALRLMNYVWGGEAKKAEQLLTHMLDGTSANPMAMIQQLSQIESGTNRQRDYTIGTLVLQAAQSLKLSVTDASSAKLSAADQAALETAIINAHLRRGDVSQVVKKLEQQLKSQPNDLSLKRRLAGMLKKSGSATHLAKAARLWREVEAKSKPGSATWYEARLSTAELLVEQGRLNECRKLLTITKALYPKLPTPELKQRLQDVNAAVK